MKNRKPKSDGRYVVNVSFTANETNLLSWADKHGNFSNYVKRLIQEDIQKCEMPQGISSELIQRMMLNMMNQGRLKDNFQNEGVTTETESVKVGSEEAPQPPKPEKKKLNKSAIGNIMKKKS